MVVPRLCGCSGFPDGAWYISRLATLGSHLPAMVIELRTLLAKFMVSRLTRPRLLVVHSWLWLAVEADDLEEKRRCLNAVLQLDPENEPAS